MTVIGTPKCDVWFQLEDNFKEETLTLIRCLYKPVLTVCQV